QRQLPALDLHQQVGEHRQGLPSFDDVDHLRKRLEEDFALQAEAHADPLCPGFEQLDKSGTVVVLVSLKTGDNGANYLFHNNFPAMKPCGSTAWGSWEKLRIIPASEAAPRVVHSFSPLASQQRHYSLSFRISVYQPSRSLPSVSSRCCTCRPACDG